VSEVKKPGRIAKISSKHQVTIPLAAMRQAGFETGDRVVARAEGPGRVVLERVHDVIGDAAGILTGVFGPDDVESLRAEWD
jgi:bifunctional DNA-binding transcriptional regulator/antitoxin component of YhaV-PrlF toxin-antitoxin module